MLRDSTSVECPKRERQISDSDHSSCTRLYDGSGEEIRYEEFVMHDDQYCIDEDIRLLCSSKTNDRPQVEEEEKHPVLDELNQEYTEKNLIG